MNRLSNDLELTQSQQDYLKQIFLLSETGETVGTQSLAERLGVRPASVTGMVQRLAQLGLVDHRRYRGVRLTDAGARVALEMLRHHRLLETFLVTTLGYTWDEVHEEAERLEHVISERFETKMAEVLGHPTHDPHGDPIPDADLRLPESRRGVPLGRIGATGGGTIVRISAQDSDSLSQLSRSGIVPDAEIEVLSVDASGIRVSVAGASHLIPSNLVNDIWIEENSR
jgi:DtxR family Mn-dependent transcriptional regulator